MGKRECKAEEDGRRDDEVGHMIMAACEEAANEGKAHFAS